MKTIAIAAGLVALASAQSLNSLPACGVGKSAIIPTKES